MTYTATGSEFIVNGTTAGDQQLDDILPLPGGKFAAKFGNTDLAGQYSTKVRTFDNGVPGAEKSLTTSASLAALSDGRIIAVTSDASGVSAQYLTSTFAKDGAALTVSTATSGLSIEAGTAEVLALADGGFAAVWKTTDAVFGLETINIQSFDAQGKPLSATPFAGAQGYYLNVSDLNMALLANGRIAVFQGKTVSVFKPDFSGGDIFNVLEYPTQFKGALPLGITGLKNGNFVFAWSDEDRSGQSIHLGPIHAQIYDLSGQRMSAEILIDPKGSGNTSFDITTLASGDFAVAWAKAGLAGEIAVRTFSPAGVEIGFEQIVNTTRPGYQYAPSISALPDGAFVIGWTDESKSAPDTSGTAVRAQIFGSNAGQVFTGTAGADKLNGTAKDDTLIGLAGDDMLNGKLGNDTVSYATASGAVTVTLGLSAAQDTGGAGKDILLAIENLEGSRFGDILHGDARGNVLTGGGGADRLYGGAGVDRLVGGTGADLLDGGKGADNLIGGDGNDTYYVDNSGDQVFESPLTGPFSQNPVGGNDKAIASVSLTLPQLVEQLVLAKGAGAIDGTGNSGDNILIGNESDNFLFGGGGYDRLTGGLSADTFELNDPKAFGMSIITDFQHGVDHIALSASFFPAFDGRQGDTLTDADLALGSKATTANQHLVYNAKTGILYYDADGAGGQAQYRIAVLLGHPQLTASDFGFFDLFAL